MNPQKIARICWNNRNWQVPSGSAGKSKGKGSYEGIKGFGHEEWLFDRGRVFKDGYHYAFIEAINTGYDTYAGKTFDIHLFTINPKKQKIYVGCIRNAMGTTAKERDAVHDYYEKQGWIEEMEDEVRAVEGNTKDFGKSWMFNVKFKFEDVILEDPQRVIEKDSVGHRYRKLMNLKHEFVFEQDENGEERTLDVSVEYRTTAAGQIVIDPRHKKIQNALMQMLKPEYKGLKLEEYDPYGQRVDLKGIEKSTGEIHFFEIKTCSARRSIREALGQILEYCHYPSVKKAQKLIIVGCQEPTENDCAYLKLLRSEYGMPVYYRCLSVGYKKLSTEY